jgi:hypothetical protein
MRSNILARGKAEDDTAGRKEAEEKCHEGQKPGDEAVRREKAEEECPCEKEKHRTKVSGGGMSR